MHFFASSMHVRLYRWWYSFFYGFWCTWFMMSRKWAETSYLINMTVLCLT